MKEQTIEKIQYMPCQGQKEETKTPVHVLAHLGSIYFQRSLYPALKKQKIVSKPTGISIQTQVLIPTRRYSIQNPGISSGSKNNKKFVDPPYHIDRNYTAYLHENANLCKTLGINLVFFSQDQKKQLQQLQKTEEYFIFKHFAKDYFLIDGHKFGGIFLAYQQDYDQHHAKYLIFNGNFNQNHMSRLAAICKKQGLFVELNQNKEITITEIDRVDSKKRRRKPKKQRQSGNEEQLQQKEGKKRENKRRRQPKKQQQSENEEQLEQKEGKKRVKLNQQ